ncbi:MAG: acylneuraminate cytidylyltransferase family protein [Clostridium sp.]|nr:acylneuraminate cytidylyltransferase family protein [Clostridium sp.]
MGNHFVAVVPARKEKAKYIDKNILPFGDSNLLVYKIRQLKKVEQIGEIVVSSDDDRILDMANAEGVKAVKRPDEYSGHGSRSYGEFISYICNEVGSEHILWTCVTSPFISEDRYIDALTTYVEKLEDGYDSLISVVPLRRYVLDKNGAVNFKKGLLHKDTDQLKSLYSATNGVAVAPRKKMIEWNYFWGNVPYMYEINKIEGLDIKDEYDYMTAKLWEEMIKNNGNETFGLHSAGRRICE